MTKTNRAAHAARMALLLDQARATVATGTCPTCGSPLVRNLALAGWWQCAGYGEPSFRKPEHRVLTHCTFQTFTE